MKKLPLMLFAGLLLAAPASRLSAHSAFSTTMAEESLDDTTARRVLALAAPLLATTSLTLYAEYQVGIVTITDLGPIRNGRRYGVTRGSDYIIIDDWVIG
jgi:hypothetical protein